MAEGQWDPIVWEKVAPERAKTKRWSSARALPGHRCPIVVDALHGGTEVPLPAPLEVRREVKEAVRAQKAPRTKVVAQSLAESVGASGFLSATVARAILDFERPAGLGLAVSEPIARLVEGQLRYQLAVPVYRAGLKQLATNWNGACLSVSVRERGDGVEASRLRWSAVRGAVDPLVPDVLLDRLADPFLVDAAHQRWDGPLEPEDVPLPDDSLGVRALVFDWVRFLQDRLEQMSLGRGEPLETGPQALWTALLDSSGLSTETRSMQAFLRLGLEPPSAEKDRFHTVEEAYKRLRTWVKDRQSELVRDFLRRPRRRDHLVWELPAAAEANELTKATASLAEVLVDYASSRRSAQPA